MVCFQTLGVCVWGGGRRTRFHPQTLSQQQSSQSPAVISYSSTTLHHHNFSFLPRSSSPLMTLLILIYFILHKLSNSLNYLIFRSSIYYYPTFPSACFIWSYCNAYILKFPLSNLFHLPFISYNNLFLRVESYNF